MNIKMTCTMTATSNEHGNATMVYQDGTIYEMNAPWQEQLAQTMLDNDWAMEVKVADKPKTPVKKKVAKKKTVKK